MKIKSKLTSLLLVFSTLLTSINLPPLTTTTYAAETHTAAGAVETLIILCYNEDDVEKYLV